MKMGDIEKRTTGRRTHWRGLIIDEGTLSEDNAHGKFLVHWFYPPRLASITRTGGGALQGWECDFSLEVVSEGR